MENTAVGNFLQHYDSVTILASQLASKCIFVYMLASVPFNIHHRCYKQIRVSRSTPKHTFPPIDKSQVGLRNYQICFV
jgi:hypothetical protein